MRVLLVEDDENIGDAVRDHVAEAGHAVDWVTNLSDARRYVRSIDYDQLLLDLSLPDGDGLELIAKLRAGKSENAPRCGVIVLTARDRLSERLRGLDAGADDYLVKPFDLDELIARMRAVARRGQALPDHNVSTNSLEIDFTARNVARDGQAVSMTSLEWALVERLARRPGAVVSRSELESALYELDREVEANTLDALVSRTRRKLGRDCIVTVRGLGYQFSTTSAPT